MGVQVVGVGLALGPSAPLRHPVLPDQPAQSLRGLVTEAERRVEGLTRHIAAAGRSPPRLGPKRGDHEQVAPSSSQEPDRLGGWCTHELAGGPTRPVTIV
jgi:hypothetical protein